MLPWNWNPLAKDQMKRKLKKYWKELVILWTSRQVRGSMVVHHLIGLAPHLPMAVRYNINSQQWCFSIHTLLFAKFLLWHLSLKGLLWKNSTWRIWGWINPIIWKMWTYLGSTTDDGSFDQLKPRLRVCYLYQYWGCTNSRQSGIILILEYLF